MSNSLSKQHIVLVSGMGIELVKSETERGIDSYPASSLKILRWHGLIEAYTEEFCKSSELVTLLALDHK